MQPDICVLAAAGGTALSPQAHFYVPDADDARALVRLYKTATNSLPK